MNHPKILLIDDSRATRSVVAKMLSGLQCEIVEAANGALGLDQAHLHLPGLIVLDMTMPVMDGVETLERLKADPATSAIPVIMLSANSNAEEMEQMKARGAAHYVTKTQKPKLILDYAMELLKLEPKPVAEAA